MKRNPQIRYKDYNVVPGAVYSLTYVSEEFEGESLGNEHELNRVAAELNEDVKKRGITEIEQIVCSSVDKTMPVYKVTRFSNKKEEKTFDHEIKTHTYNVSVKAKCGYTQEEADKLNNYYKRNDQVASELIERGGWIEKYKTAINEKHVRPFGGLQFFFLFSELFLMVGLVVMLGIPSLNTLTKLTALFKGELEKSDGLIPIIFLALALLTFIFLIVFIVSAAKHAALSRKNSDAKKKMNKMLTSNTKTVEALEKEYEELTYVPDDIHICHVYSVHVKGNVISYDLK